MNAFVFLANGFEEIEAITPIDMLRRAGIDVTTVSISENKEVVGAHNIPIIADTIFAETDFSKADLLLLPGGMPGTNNLNACEELKILIKKHTLESKLIAAICAAPIILGQMSLLEGEKAVCYPSFENQLKGADVQFNKVEISENIITARGAGCAIEFALTIIETLCGKSKSEEIAQSIIF